ncbi:MAG: zf-HC2 domain-containing protein [Bacteroidota bacterium]
MNCVDIEKHLLSYLDGTLTAKEKEAFEAHLAQCNGCSRKLAQFQELEAMLPGLEVSLDEVSVAPPFPKSVSVREKHLKAAPVRHWVHSFVKVAAVLLIFIGGAWFGRILTKQNEGPRLTSLEQEVATLQKQVYVATLRESRPSDKLHVINCVDVQEDQVGWVGVYSYLLTRDENANVRLAAAEALSELSGNDEARNVLLGALSVEQSPLVQVRLIELLVATGDERLESRLKKIITDENTPGMVKNYARMSLQYLHKSERKLSV